MTLTEDQRRTFETAALPLIQWLNENCHLHAYAEVNPGGAVLVEEVARVVNLDFIED